MSLLERVYRVLIVSASQSFNTSVLPLLPETNYAPVVVVSCVSEAKRMILERSFDFILINSPLPDDTGVRFATDLCRTKGAIVLLFVRAEFYDQIYEKATPNGIFTLPKPTSRQMVSQALRWMAAACERLRNLEKKSVSVEEKMEEIRLVNRAKWLLIDREKMSEPEAHRLIEKQAMDRCLSRREIALEIIQNYHSDKNPPA